MFVCSCLLCLVWQLPPWHFSTLLRLCWPVLMLHHGSDSSWPSDPVILLLEGSESPISALFNFYAGKTSEKLMSPEYSIHFLPIVCIKTQKLGSHSEQFRMSEDEYTLRPGFSELFWLQSQPGFSTELTRKWMLWSVHWHISLQVAVFGAIVDTTQNVTLSQLTLANTAKQKVAKPKL